MPRTVKLMHNQYLQRLHILIDDAEISTFSSLHQYLNDPFTNWCDRILDSIVTELNGDRFYLQFSSSEENALVMKTLAQNYSLCCGWQFIPLIRKDSLQKRMKTLNDFIRAKNIPVQRQNISVNFILTDEVISLKEELLSLDIKNSFCKVNIKVKPMKEFLNGGANFHENFFIITSQDISQDWFQNYKGFLIQLSKLTENDFEFLRKYQALFIYRTRPEFLVQAIFKCMLFEPLLNVFRRCIAELPSNIINRYKEQIELLQSVTNKIIPVIKSRVIELHHSNHISFESDIADYPVDVSKLTYKYSNEGIIRCNGLLVEGLRVGESILYVHYEGNILPCVEIPLSVIIRNRIEEIIFPSDVIVVGEQTGSRINFRIVPTDADNVSSIKWSSSDSDIAEVDDRNILIAHKQGVCDILCCAENVSSGFRCIVKPFLKEIVPEEDAIKMIIGESRDLKIHLVPQNALNSKLLISSMDRRVANIVGTKIEGVGVGKTQIIIEDVEQKIKKIVFVEVSAKKNWLLRLFS